MKTTLNKIRQHQPCSESWRMLLKHLGKTQADDEPLSIKTILLSNGFDDALWCLRAVDGYAKEMRLYAVWCARKVQHLTKDRRSLKALDVAEAFAYGQATADKLNAARAAAVKAAGEVLWEAAEKAARKAAGAAAGGAAWEAAWEAAWAAEWATAWDAAERAAKWAAAGEAAWAAEWAAKGAQAAEAQRQELLRILNNIDSKAGENRMSLSMERLEEALEIADDEIKKLMVENEALKAALAKPIIQNYPEKDNREPVAWLITDEKINSLQVNSIQRLIDLARHAHMIDIKLRINGQDEWYQADWLKHLTRTTPPQGESNFCSRCGKRTADLTVALAKVDKAQAAWAAEWAAKGAQAAEAQRQELLRILNNIDK